MPSLLDKSEVPAALAELDPTIPLISPSQLKVYSRCAYNWNMLYIRGWSAPSRDQAETGLILHDLMRVYYDYRKNLPKSPQLWRVAVENRLKEYQERFETYEQIEQVTKAGKIMLRYCDYAPVAIDLNMVVEGVEKHFIVLFYTPTGKPFYMQGYIDLFYHKRNNSYRVRDHKSIPHVNKAYSSDQVQNESQTLSYCLALQELGYKCSDAEISNVNTYPYKDLPSQKNESLFKLTSAHYSERELETFKHELGLMVDEMFYTPGRPIRRSIDKSCASCYMKDPCLMERKGIDITRLLEQKFVRRTGKEVLKDLVIGVDNPVRV